MVSGNRHRRQPDAQQRRGQYQSAPVRSGILTLSSSLTLNGATLPYVSGDQIAVGSALTLTGTDVVVPNSPLSAGTLTLFTYNGGVAERDGLCHRRPIRHKLAANVYLCHLGRHGRDVNGCRGAPATCNGLAEEALMSDAREPTRRQRAGTTPTAPRPTIFTRATT